MVMDIYIVYTLVTLYVYILPVQFKFEGAILQAICMVVILLAS